MEVISDVTNSNEKAGWLADKTERKFKQPALVNATNYDKSYDA